MIDDHLLYQSFIVNFPRGIVEHIAIEGTGQYPVATVPKHLNLGLRHMKASTSLHDIHIYIATRPNDEEHNIILSFNTVRLSDCIA
jgi:hypothetical protein